MTVVHSDRDTLVDHALAYLARGLPVFPVCTPAGDRRCLQHGACPNAGKRPLVLWRTYERRTSSSVGRRRS